jgi:hypothetical protein
MTLYDTESNQEADKELRDIFMSTGKIETSPDFTQNIMSLIEKEALVNQTIYKPLISTGGWIGIAVFILVIFLTALTYGTGQDGQTIEIVQRINHIFNFQIPVDILIATFSRIGDYLLSSRVFLSLTGLLGLGVIYSFFFLKIEGLRKTHLN